MFWKNRKTRNLAKRVTRGFEILEIRTVLATDGFTKVYEHQHAFGGAFDPLVSMNSSGPVSLVHGPRNELFLGDGDVPRKIIDNSNKPNTQIRDQAVNDSGDVVAVIHDSATSRDELRYSMGLTAEVFFLPETFRSTFKSIDAIALNNAGTVVFVGVLQNGATGVYRFSFGELETIVERRADFYSFGKWIALNDEGDITFYFNGALYTVQGVTATVVAGIPSLPRVDIGNAFRFEPSDSAPSPTLDFIVSVTFDSSVRTWPIEVTYHTTDINATAGSDYGSRKGTLSIPPGEHSGVISIPISPDDIAEDGIEAFAVSLDTINGDVLPYAVLGDAHGVGTIGDDDFESPHVSVSFGRVEDVVEGNSGKQEAIVTVFAGGVGHAETTISFRTFDITATAGKDYTAVQGSLTFPSDVGMREIRIPILADNIHDGGVLPRDEVFGIVFGDGQTGALNANIAECRIIDDEPWTQLTSDGEFSANNLGQIALSANLRATNSRGDLGDRIPAVLVAGNGLAPRIVVDGRGPFNEFGGNGTAYSARINDRGTVAFWASLDSGGYGIFTGADPVVDKVIAVADVLDDVTVTDVQSRFALNNEDQVAFAVGKLGNQLLQLYATSVYRTGGSLESTAVTVVTHGYAPFGSGGPLTDMAENLFRFWNRSSDPAVYLYEQATGELIFEYGSQNPSHKIIMFNWREEADLNGAGFDETAGDALFAMLVQHSLLDSDYLHLIGHSRGTVVTSEASQRLVYYGYRVDQVTILDSEPGFVPLNAVGIAHAWEGIQFVDNHYGGGSTYPTTPVGGPILFTAQGDPVNGAFNAYYPELGHVAVRTEYQDSIANASESEFYAYRAFPELRAEAQRQIVGRPTRLSQPPSVTNGDFVFFGESDVETPGWEFHGGGGIGRQTAADQHGQVLKLSDSTDPFRHNRLYAAGNVLRFESQVTEASSLSTFRVVVHDVAGVVPDLIADVGLDPTVTSDWDVHHLNMAQFHGRIVTIGFHVIQDFLGRSPSIFIDNVAFANSVRQNGNLQFDVNRSGAVEPADVLVLIDDINRRGVRTLGATSLVDDPFVDTNGDGLVTPHDVLLVIDHVNRAAEDMQTSAAISAGFLSVIETSDEPAGKAPSGQLNEIENSIFTDASLIDWKPETSVLDAIFASYGIKSRALPKLAARLAIAKADPRLLGHLGTLQSIEVHLWTIEFEGYVIAEEF